MADMTKRRYPEDLPERPRRKSSGSGAASLVLALMFGAAVALTADSGADPRAGYKQAAQQMAAQVTKSISSTLRSLNVAKRDDSIRVDGALSGSPSATDVPVIAVVIDDLGVNLERTNRAIALPANVTLSFLPYPPRSLDLSRRAHLAGHEVLVHLPMQPAGQENPGERALIAGLPPAELKQRLDWALSRVSNYDGVNNHMGSRFTESAADLSIVMAELKARRLFFLDSRTSANSQAPRVAHEFGVLSGRRDVFLDGERNVAAIKRQLARAEASARANGNVIVIGHPYPETLSVLTAWSKTIKARGYRLAPVREVMILRDPRTPALLTAGISLSPAVKE
jgi:polysaccharide deacetylase 2 family uncharacterized protein YibQ